MARTTYVKSAQQRYAMVPVIDPATGQQKITPVISKRTGAQKTTKSGKPVVLRVFAEDRTKPLPPHKCERCGKVIEPGMPYKHVSPKSGPYGGRKRIRCGDCPGWRPSELSSSKMASIMAAQEDLDTSSVESADDLGSMASEFAEVVRGVAEEYRESASNMEDGFGHETTMSADLNERADALESWADEIEALDFDEAPDADEYNLNEEGEEFDEERHGDTAPDFCYNADGESYDEAMDSWRDEQGSKLDDLANETP